MDEVISSKRVTDEIIGFHSQQAVEKLLKTVLSELKIVYRKSRDLNELLAIINFSRGYQMIEWLLQNKEWFFSGIGALLVSLVVALCTWLFRKKRHNGTTRQRLNSGDYSSPMQAGRDINISMATNQTNTQNVIKMIIAAIDKNSRIVDSLKEQYDRITKPSIDYMPKCSLDLYFLRNVMGQKHEFLENMPSSEVISEAISNLLALETNLETLRITAERELVKSRKDRVYQQDIILQCKKQLPITQSALRKAKETLNKIG